MIILYTTPPAGELPSISPSCMKLETWLRMANIPYKTATEFEFTKAPKGKIPFIEYQGQLIGDSTLIIQMFKEKEGIDLDKNLTTTEKAISLAFRRMLKEHTYWGLGYIRYNIAENWQIYREILANTIMPGATQEEWEPVVNEIRNTSYSQMYNQGMSRHSYEEIIQLINADFQALADFLADKPFFMGDQPTTLDATAYAYIGNAIKLPFQSPIIDYVLPLKNLCQHYERMTEQFFRKIS